MANSKLQIPSKTNMFYSEDDFIFETEMVEDGTSGVFP